MTSMSRMEDDSGWTWLERPLVSLAQRIPRRSFLGKAGAGLLGAVGITVLERGLPLLEPEAAEASDCADTGCSGAEWCGLCGRRCNNSNCQGTATSCPSGTTKAGYWSACCCFPFIGGCLRSVVRYYDCCKGSGTHCNAPRCCNRISPPCTKTPTGAYCTPSKPVYWCTIYFSTGTAC